jgi:hydroxymethylbilane synthase
LRELLAGLPRMLLPLNLCPAAPAQGALAIECRTDDARTRALLAAIDDAATRAAIGAERALLAERGGGCHQRFGATQVQVSGLGALLYVREAGEAGVAAPQLRWSLPEPPRAPLRPWDGSAQAAPEVARVEGAAEVCAQRLAASNAAFIAHRRALPDMPSAAVNRCAHIWVSGTESWFALAARGVWVEGCAEALGFEALQSTLGSPLLSLPRMGQWLALTNEEAAPGWDEVPVLATYRHASAPQPLTAPGDARQLWWASGVQFERWRAQLGADCQHACGPGKTAATLRRAGVREVTVFPSVHHWREWLRTCT